MAGRERRGRAIVVAALGALLTGALVWPAAAAADVAELVPDGAPSLVTVEPAQGGGFRYLVDGQPSVFIGVGYNPIYRYLPDGERESNYRRDFAMLRDAGVNIITGWDEDKGYEQDAFDELTLTVADQHGLGVVMPMYLPPEGDYENPALVDALLDSARERIEQFKDFHAVRMWGLGNEVLWEMPPEQHPAFIRAYLQLADLFHELDPNHPVVYREAEDRFVPEIVQALRDTGDMRPWLLYGTNIYNHDVRPILSHWPEYGLDRPLIVSEFGTQGDTPDQRAQGYLAMWRSIRCYPYVLGGAPYAWTTAGPEPTDKIWGLMDAQSRPVDGTFGLLSAAWRADTVDGASGCQPAAQPEFVPPSSPLPQPRAPAPRPTVGVALSLSVGSAGQAKPSVATLPSPTAGPQSQKPASSSPAAHPPARPRPSPVGTPPPICRVNHSLRVCRH